MAEMYLFETTDGEYYFINHPTVREYFDLMHVLTSDDFNEEREVRYVANTYEIYIIEHIGELIDWLLVGTNAKSVSVTSFGDNDTSISAPVYEAINYPYDEGTIYATFKSQYGMTHNEFINLPLLEFYWLMNSVMLMDGTPLSKLVSYRVGEVTKDDTKEVKSQKRKLRMQYEIPSGQKVIDRYNASEKARMDRRNALWEEIGK